MSLEKTLTSTCEQMVWRKIESKHFDCIASGAKQIENKNRIQTCFIALFDEKQTLYFMQSKQTKMNKAHRQKEKKNS